MADKTYSAAIYDGVVFHERFSPFNHKLTYKVFSLLLDVDKVAQVAATSQIFSLNKWNLFSFHDSDHGNRDGTPLRPWVEKQLQGLNISGFDPAHSKILLFCFPRILGYVFNPISLLFCYDEASRLRAVLYEVKNTFGEQHCYVTAIDDANALKHEHNAEKVFHVSPFMEMDCRYDFQIKAPDDAFYFRIDQNLLNKDTGNYSPILLATHTGKRAEFNDKALWSRFFRYPLMTLKVILAIHFEAIHLVRKGAKYFKKPKPPENASTYMKK